MSRRESNEDVIHDVYFIFDLDATVSRSSIAVTSSLWGVPDETRHILFGLAQCSRRVIVSDDD